MIGDTEILIIGAVFLLLFGGSKIPELARSIGKAKSEFEKGLKDKKKKRGSSKNGCTNT